ncbi:MAG: ADP-ribosylglycohydrolase family protein [Candidatus Thermoplasmatota archaeon]
MEYIVDLEASKLRLSKEERQDKFRGCMLGSALGDAVGELAFKYPSKEKLLSVVKDADEVRYTDDSAMAIGIAESLIENQGELNQHHLGETFRKNYQEEPWRGYGQGPPKIFRMVARKEKESYVEAAETLFDGEGSMGNGSAMRIAPVGIFFEDEEKVAEEAERSAEVTHTHELGRDGAAVLASAINIASNRSSKDSSVERLKPVETAERLSKIAKTEVFTEALEDVKRFVKTKTEREVAAEELGTGVLIHRSVPYAIFSFLMATSSFEEALMNAIMVRGDRDTIGAMTGALSGAYLGKSSIPDDLIQKLENGEYIESLADRLFELDLD